MSIHAFSPFFKTVLIYQDKYHILNNFVDKQLYVGYWNTQKLLLIKKSSVTLLQNRQKSPKCKTMCFLFFLKLDKYFSSLIGAEIFLF